MMTNNRPEWLNNPVMKAIYLFLSQLPDALIEEEYKTITLHQETKMAEINFYDYDAYGILELSIVNTQTGRIKFYLHLEPVEITDVEEVMEAFLETWNCTCTCQCLVSNPHFDKGHLRVLLVCTSGITSGMFAHYMQITLDEMHADVSVESVSLAQLDDLIPQCYDVILLTPQVSQYYPEMLNKFGDHIQKIDIKDFATMNVQRVIRSL